MQKKGVAVVGALLALSMSVVARSAQQPAPQASPSAGAPPSTVRDQDIEMLRANLRQQRKEIMAQNMTLTPEEATKFWPVFDQYRKEAIKPNDLRWEVMKEYVDHYQAMTDAQAEDYMKRSVAVDQELLELRLKYVPIFEKVISARKTALWFQIDRRIDLLINLQLSSSVPMAGTAPGK
jgi:Spy/CpxP family protein refolding chaperone